MINLLKKGIITLPIGIVLALGTIGSAYFVNLIGTNDKISDAKEELHSELSNTNERVSVVETQVTSILKSQERMEENINKITNYLMGKND